MEHPLRIGLCFPNHDVDSWHRLLENALHNQPWNGRVPQVDFIKCPNVDDLRGAAPLIIAAHESSGLVEYLRERPVSLEWVQVMSAGVDRLLSVLGPVEVPFRITTVRGIHASAMREYAVGALFYFYKSFGRWRKQMERRSWDRASLRIAAGETAVVLGTGAIGGAIAGAFSALGLHVIGVSRSGAGTPGFDEVYPMANLHAALGRANCIVLALPLTQETRGVLGWAEFGQIRPGAVLINVARGELIDDAALNHALVQGTLSGAALDAFIEEPLPPTSPLWNLPNVLITPHVSGRFEGGRELGAERFVRNLSMFLNSQPLEGEVFPQRGY